MTGMEEKTIGRRRDVCWGATIHGWLARRDDWKGPAQIANVLAAVSCQDWMWMGPCVIPVFVEKMRNRQLHLILATRNGPARRSAIANSAGLLC